MISLDKSHPTYAVVEYGDLILRGSVILNAETWVKINVESVKGCSGIELDWSSLRGRHLAFAKVDCDLYR